MKRILSIFTLILVLMCLLTSCNLPFLPGAETTTITLVETTPKVSAETTTAVPVETTTEVSLETTSKAPEETTVTPPAETTVTTLEETTVTIPEETTVTTPEDVTSSIPHEHVEEPIEGKEPTCTQTGLTEGKKCSDCGAILIAQEIIPARHNYSAAFVAPTAKEDGYTKHTCSNCGDSYVADPIMPIGFTVTQDNRAKVGYTVETDKNLVIPAVFQEDNIWYRVTAIGNSAFRYCSNLTSVTIPDSVTTIGDEAFGLCNNLTSVTIGNSVTTIGYFAFAYCSNLTNVTIPDSATTISSGAFYDCNPALYARYEYGNYVGDSTNPYAVLIGVTNKILSTYTIHPDTKIIADSVFSCCERLTNITIPDGVRGIGDYAIYDCYNLTSVTIGNSVTFIGEGVFEYCFNLTSIIVDEDNSTYQSINGNLYSKDGTVLIAYAIGKTDTTFVIPDFVTTIGDYAFYYCLNLTGVTIGNSVTTICDSAFENCSNLTSVTIPDSVTTIGERAFSYCNSALYAEYGSGKYVGDSTNPYKILIEGTSTIHPDTKIIAHSAFANCWYVANITIPDGVRVICDSAFYKCFDLTSITIPDSVTIIGSYAFAVCASLTSVTIPDSVTTIGYSAFSSCNNLTSVIFTNPNNWECEYYLDATNVVAISASELSNPEIMAQYLKDTYLKYYWYRTE